MTPKLYHLHALSALHCGTGQSIGVIDLPIARDRASNLPLVPGSSLRGVLRDNFASETGDAAENLEKSLFGPRKISGNDDSYAGALAVGDAHLLLLPIRALAGIVAYATCPFVLRRYARDVSKAPAIPTPAATPALHACDNLNKVGDKIILEDLDLDAKESADVSAWAQAIAKTIHPDDKEAQDDLCQRFLVLPDSVFAFLAETATEIRARIAIDEKTGTVKKGALWYEENLPAETVLWGVYALSDSRLKGDTAKAAELTNKIPASLILQIGGKAGVGRGLTRFLNGDSK